MSLRVNANVTSLAIQNALGMSQKITDRALKNLATGSRLSDPSADVAGSAIASQMSSELKSMGSAKMNAETAVSVVSVAEGSLNEQSNILMRLRELSVQAASDTYSKTERALMQKESAELALEFDRIAKTTKFGSQSLLDGSISKFDFQVGVSGGAESRITYNSDANTTAGNLDIDAVSVEDKSDALDSIGKVDKAMEKIAMARAKFGATQSRLESAQNTLSAQIENISAARSRIADADVAKEASEARRGQVLQQYQTSMLQQVNEQASLGIKLIA